MIGQTLAHYEILELIGQGGMGEVYRARDPKLGRDVAIKVLPKDFAGDAERLARFEQEARTVGSLNHPALVTVFELGRHEGAPYMVMELIEGDTLRDKLGASGPATGGGDSDPHVAGQGLPVRKAVDLAVQIARGLGAAHQQGIVHRDLKPENVLVTRDGRAKILDFGLAKLTATAPEDPGVDATQAMKTEPGKVMGTVGYMSPEQVRGQETDHRTDIFSLGLLLFEMISGRRAFQADTSVETMSAILNQDPPTLTAASGPRLSPSIERIVRRCLEKEPAQRFQSANDLAYALDAMQEDSSAAVEALAAPATRSGGRRPVWVALVVLAGVVGLLAGRALDPGSGPADERPAAHLLPLTFEPGPKASPRLSPDGRSFVYMAVEDDRSDILLRRIGGENVINLTAGSEGSNWHPAWSPDGEQIAFVSERDGGGIFVMGATGESVRRVTDFGFNPAWSPDGTRLVFNEENINDPRGRTTTSALWVVELESGATTKIHEGDGVEADWSPDGRWIAFWGLPSASGDRVIWTIPADGGEPQRIFGGNAFNWNPRWMPDGRALVFASSRSGTMDLWRIPMDPSTGRAAGEARPLTTSTEWIAEPGLSRDGRSLVCISQRESTVLSRIDLTTGERTDLRETSRALTDLDVSPDGGTLALSVRDANEDIFVVPSEGGAWRRLTQDEFKDRQPRFSPDGEHIYFFSDRSGRYEVWRIRPDGSGLTQITALTGDNVSIPRPSPDGERVLIGSGSRGQGYVDLTGPLPVTEIDWIEWEGSDERFWPGGWSPDGAFAHGSDERRQGVLFSAVDRSFRPLPELGRVAGWTPDSSGIVQLRDGRLEQLDPFAHTTTPLAEEGSALMEALEGVGRIVLSPDGRFLYAFSFREESDVWLLELGGAAR